MRRRSAGISRFLWIVVVVLGPGLLTAAGPAVAAAGPALAAARPNVAAIGPNPKGAVDRVITDRRITESSGLTPSLLHPDVFWTHNDSGNPPLIYAVGRSGKTESTVTVEGEPDVDWEAITSLRGPAKSPAPGAALIAIGDIGDNNAQHTNVRIAIVREPKALKSFSEKPIRVLRLRYPGGPRDAEALLADPRTGQFYIVDKTLFGSTLYSVPTSIWPGDGRTGVSPITTVKLVAHLSAGLITDGAFLPDGRIVLRGYGQVFVVDKPSTVKDERLKVLADGMLPLQDQGESIAPTDGGREALIGSEGKNEPVYKINLPVVPGDRALAQAARPSPSGSGAAENDSGGSITAGTTGSAGSAGSDHRFSGISGRRLGVGLVGAVLVLVALVALLGLVRSRSRSPRYR